MPLPMEMTEVSVKEKCVWMVVFEGIAEFCGCALQKAQEFVDEVVGGKKVCPFVMLMVLCLKGEMR